MGLLEKSKTFRLEAVDQTTINQETSDQEVNDQETDKQKGSNQKTFGQGTIDRDHEMMSADDFYRRRYLRCRQLMEADVRFSGMTDEERDAYAQRLATPEYLDLTCDWAFKYIFQNHPDLLILLLNDILQEDIKSVEFRNTELTEISPKDKRILLDLLCKTPNGTILVEMQKALRFDQRDRLLFYGSRLVTRQVERGDEEYALSPVKVICIMNYEDDHPNSPEGKILYHYRLQEVETVEPFGDQMSFYLLELPRIMRYTEEYESPVAAWCRIFRNFAIFAKSRSERDAVFDKLEMAMRVSGLDDSEIDNYFSDMMTEKEMHPYIEGARQQGYRHGVEQGRAEGMKEGIEKGIEKGIENVAASMLNGGMCVSDVARFTGLSEQRLNALGRK
ncbi:MAG TPA: hypothetical protein DD383_03465 [Rikenellaceae bacterium]|nr:hypothetical protein [Rikenellaceae bacterium]